MLSDAQDFPEGTAVEAHAEPYVPEPPPYLYVQATRTSILRSVRT